MIRQRIDLLYIEVLGGGCPALTGGVGSSAMSPFQPALSASRKHESHVDCCDLESFTWPPERAKSIG